MCFSAVFTLIPSSAATALFGRPRATKLSDLMLAPRQWGILLGDHHSRHRRVRCRHDQRETTARGDPEGQQDSRDVGLHGALGEKERRPDHSIAESSAARAAICCSRAAGCPNRCRAGEAPVVPDGAALERPIAGAGEPR